MLLVPVLPLSLQELLDYYRIAARECDFLVDRLHKSLYLLEIRMKPSAVVSVQFNKYEGYYIAFLQHLTRQSRNQTGQIDGRCRCEYTLYLRVMNVW
jgi:hypothetical protein